VSGLFITPVARLRRFVGASSPLNGKVVLVTGASSGIGAATMRAVAERGAIAVGVARREGELAEVVAAVNQAGPRGEAYGYPCDLTDEDAVKAVMEQIAIEHGGVDYLVNNAGRSIRRSVELSYDRMHDFERTMEINYFAPVRLTLAVLPHMRAQKFGHIVNILSWGVQVRAPKFSAYLASKGALDIFSRIVGREAYGDNVTVTNVRMPLVRTDMIGPTETYRRSPALTPEQAAAKVVRALEERPVTVDTLVGNATELANIVFPRISDFTTHHLAKMFPDSAAAQGNREL
jgi:NAD(P)-dependent dehydrogenase (short-subunit alcohol dehydrogenase family)